MSAPKTAEAAPVVPAANADRKRKLLLLVSFIAVCLIWGSTWIAVKLAVTDMPPLTASGLRFVVAAPLFIAGCRAMGKPLAYPRRLNWFFAYIFACYFAVPYFLFNYGEQYISSGLTAICFSSVAVMMVVFSVPILRTRITTTQFVAVVFAFTALGALIVHSQGIAVTSGWGVAAVLGAATMHALTYILIKKHGREIHSLTLNTMPMALAGIVLTGLGFIVEQPGAEAFTARSVGATLFLGVVASAIGFVVYFWLVQRTDTVTSSFVFVLFPIVAQLFGILVEGARFDVIDLVLTLAILGAFAVTQWGQRRTASVKGGGGRG
ncbi:DMT family transporter [Actinosynnema sp. NPDC023658]|uniref:DMT family transporter n=1 Tax=Actinosynnema sp. NPDC023658 TaxID=3155465 RepID=UPI0033DAC202